MSAGIPYESELVDISSTDHTFTKQTLAIVSSGAGTIVAQLRGDSTSRSWPVVAGIPLPGNFSKIVRAGTTGGLTIIGMVEQT